MNFKHFVPALILGLSLSSIAMARTSHAAGKRSHKAKAEKTVREGKAKKSKDSELRQ